MKKFLAFLFLAMVAIASISAQGSKTGYINPGSSYLDYSFADADTIGAVNTTYSIIAVAPQHEGSYQDVLVKLHNVSTGRATVQFQGAAFDGQAYTNIGSAINWHGDTADTTIYINNATAKYYRYYKILVTRTLGKSKITDAQVKLWLTTK